jgi:hypothetical protein
MTRTFIVSLALCAALGCEGQKMDTDGGPGTATELSTEDCPAPTKLLALPGDCSAGARSCGAECLGNCRWKMEGETCHGICCGKCLGCCARMTEDGTCGGKCDGECTGACVYNYGKWGCSDGLCIRGCQDGLHDDPSPGSWEPPIQSR